MSRLPRAREWGIVVARILVERIAVYLAKISFEKTEETVLTRNLSLA